MPRHGVPHRDEGVRWQVRRVARRRAIACSHRHHVLEPITTAMHDVHVGMLLRIVGGNVPLVGEVDESRVLRLGRFSAALWRRLPRRRTTDRCGRRLSKLSMLRQQLRRGLRRSPARHSWIPISAHEFHQRHIETKEGGKETTGGRDEGREGGREAAETTARKAIRERQGGGAHV